MCTAKSQWCGTGFNCNIALTTLHVRTELTQFQDGGYPVHSTFTCIIYAVSKFHHSVMCTWICVQGVCTCREACRFVFTRISCHVGKVPKWHLKGSHLAKRLSLNDKRFARFLHCVEVIHDLDYLDVLYRGIRAYTAAITFTRITSKFSVLNVSIHTFCSFLFILQ